MKKLSCFLLALILIVSAGFPSAMAVCYRQCQRFDIWQHCYVNEVDRTLGCICTDESGDGFCDNCSDRLCYTDGDDDGQCDVQNECVRTEQEDCKPEHAFSGGHGGKGSHHGGGRKHCR